MREACDLAATQNRNEEEHHSSGLGELRKWKQAYKKLSSEKGAVISALLAEKDSVWHQLKKMESDYTGCLKSKKIEIEQAIEAVEKLKAVVEKLQSSATDKDERIVKLKADLSRVQLALGSRTREVQVLVKK
uniref:Synaptonemal complex protein 1 n=1 Tax=Anthurium amnicola TaxID=1678845 RepID=A0A1D1XYK0_9ARAE